MNKAYLSLGSNRGDRIGNLSDAVKLLSERVGSVSIVSSLYETKPWKMEDETDFLNQALLLETNLTAVQLMDTIIQIESFMGRVRTQKKYEPRIIDIDILFFNNEVINSLEVNVPHPLMHERRFVLEPIVEISPAYIHPVLKKSMEQLLKECPDKSGIKKSISK